MANKTLNNLEPWELEDGEFLPTNFHYETSKPYRLWFEYLRISPTYWLAHKEISGADGGLSEQEKRNLPAYFDKVIETYNHFGDIYKAPFRIWWLDTGAQLFGKPKRQYLPKLIGTLESNNYASLTNCIDNIKSHALTTGLIENHPNCLLLSIPLIGSSEEILKNIADNLSERLINELDIKGDALYKLEGERLRLDTLTTGLRLLWIRLENPSMAWWKLGQLAKISKSYPEFDFDETNQTEKQAESKKHLASMTQTMFRKTIDIVGNVAIGKFPLQEKRNFDDLKYHGIFERTQNQKLADINYMKKVRDEIDNNMDLFIHYE